MTRTNKADESDNVERFVERPDSAVERMYNEELDRIGPVARLRRSLRMSNEIRRMMIHAIRKESPGASEREIYRHLAMKLYQLDKRTLESLRQI